LVYINIVVVLFVLAAFISIDPSPAIIEDLSWGYLDDHQFQGNDTVYINWCNRFFEPQACTAPIKMSGYFALRSARVTYRAWDQFFGNFSLDPTTLTVKYSEDDNSCVLPFGDVCDDCDANATTAAAFTLILLIVQIFVLIDQLRDMSGRVIDESEDYRVRSLYIGAYGFSFVCGVVAYVTMKYGCLMKVPMMLSTGPMSILMMAVIFATLVQLVLEFVWLNATRPSNEVNPDGTIEHLKDADGWSKPVKRDSVAPPGDPFAIDKQPASRGRPGSKRSTQPPPITTHGNAPTKPDFYDPFEAAPPRDSGAEPATSPRSPPSFVPTQHTAGVSSLTVQESG